MANEVLLYHYSALKPIQMQMCSLTDQKLYLSNPDKKIMQKFHPEDPIVLFIRMNDRYQIQSGDIEQVNLKEAAHIIIELDFIAETDFRRSCKRYPAASFCNVRSVQTGKRHAAILKNLSLSGMMVYMQYAFKAGEMLEITMNLAAASYFVEATVVRVTEGKRYNKYALQLRDNDAASIRLNRLFLKYFQAEYAKNLFDKYSDELQVHEFAFDAFEEMNPVKRLEFAVKRLERALQSSN